MRILASTLLLIIAAAIAAGCGGSATGAEGKALTDVIVASDLPLTGSARAQTESMVQAIEMRLAENNNKAGGVKITYKSLDDATAQAGKWDEAKCAENMNKLAQDPKVVAVVGPMNSGCAQVQIKTANAAGLAMVSPAATAVGLTKDGGDPGEPDKYYPNGVRNFVRVTLADDMQGKAAAKWAADLGVKKAFVLHDKETYGKGIADQFEGAAEKAGIDVVHSEGIDPMASNYRALMPKITKSGVQLVYFGGITQNNAGQIVKDLRAGSKDILFMGPDGIFEDAYAKAAGSAGEGSMATFGGIPPEKLTGKGAAFVKAFTAKHEAPQAYTAYAYDAAGIVLEAIERCAAGKGVTRPCVLEELFATKDHEGALGSFSITETGDTTLSVLSGVKVKSGAWAFDRMIEVEAPVAK
ncbi:MAG: Extracellular ligand-binding receptor [Thermoleophilia bacterium]|nr:Extracellular ligand-binding receptor [Thermoleophilia bacterium]MCZ4496699.1 Extracellular ligand-binding receptor [Thermoleophilia bacterium]